MTAEAAARRSPGAAVAALLVIAWGTVMVFARFDAWTEPATSRYRPVSMGVVWLVLGCIALAGSLALAPWPRAERATGLALMVAGLSVSVVPGVFPGATYFRVPPTWLKPARNPPIYAGFLMLAATSVILAFAGALIFRQARAPRHRKHRRRVGMWVLLVAAASMAGFALWTGWLYGWAAPPGDGTLPGADPHLWTSQDSNLGFHRFIVFLAVWLALWAGLSVGAKSGPRPAVPVAD